MRVCNHGKGASRDGSEDAETIPSRCHQSERHLHGICFPVRQIDVRLIVNFYTGLSFGVCRNQICPRSPADLEFYKFHISLNNGPKKKRKKVWESLNLGESDSGFRLFYFLTVPDIADDFFFSGNSNRWN